MNFSDFINGLKPQEKPHICLQCGNARLVSEERNDYFCVHCNKYVYPLCNACENFEEIPAEEV